MLFIAPSQVFASFYFSLFHQDRGETIVEVVFTKELLVHKFVDHKLVYQRVFLTFNKDFTLDFQCFLLTHGDCLSCHKTVISLIPQ